MIFMLFFYADEDAIARMTPEEMNATIDRHIRYYQVVQESAHIYAAGGLEPSHTAMTVRPADGELVTAPGSPTPAKETLQGVYVIDCKDMDEAVAIARRYPMPEGRCCGGTSRPA
jgi:hypothetical protein